MDKPTKNEKKPQKKSRVILFIFFNKKILKNFQEPSKQKNKQLSNPKQIDNNQVQNNSFSDSDKIFKNLNIFIDVYNNTFNQFDCFSSVLTQHGANVYLFFNSISDHNHKNLQKSRFNSIQRRKAKHFKKSY